MGRKGRKRLGRAVRQAVAKKGEGHIGSFHGWTDVPSVAPDTTPTYVVLALLGAIALLLVLVGVTARHFDFRLILVLGVLGVMGSQLLRSVGEPLMTRSRVSLRVDRKGLRIDRSFVPRHEIRAVSLDVGTQSDRPVVVIDRAIGPTIHLEMPNEKAAHRLVHALSFADGAPPRVEPPAAPAPAPEPDPAPDPTPVRRRDRSIEAWLGALRSIGSGAEAGPRTAPVPRDRLLRIVEDAASLPVDRAAAAVALGHDADETERTRLRIVAEDANDELREVIDRVTGDADDEAIAEALAVMDTER